MAETETDLLRSSLDLLVLKALSWGPKHGYAISEWGMSENNRRAKFYELTTAGRTRFRVQAPVWHRHVEAITAALRRTSPELA